MIQAVAIFVAEKLVGGVFSKIGGEAILGPAKGAIGIDSDTEKLMGQLKIMSDVLSGISSKIDAVPSKVAFVSKWQSCENKIDTVLNLLDKAKEDKQLAKSQWQEIINFIKEGTEENDYYSLASSLFNAAYGISFNTCFKWKEGFKKLPAGKQEYCYSHAINNFLLHKPIGISDYIDKHVHFAASLYAMIEAVCITAEKAYTILKKQLEKMPAGETAELIKEAVNNAEVKRNVLDPKEKFIERAKPFIINAFQSEYLCGYTFELYAQLKEGKAPAIAIYSAQKFKKKNKKLYPIRKARHFEILFESEDPKGWEMSFSDKLSENKVQFLSMKDKDRKLYLGMTTYRGNEIGEPMNYLDIGNKSYPWELLVLHKPSYGIVYLLRDTYNYSMRIDNPGSFREYLGAEPRAKYKSIDVNDDDFYWYIEPGISA